MKYTRTSGFFQISASVDNVRHIFIYLKNDCRDANGFRQLENTPYTMNTFNSLVDLYYQIADLNMETEGFILKLSTIVNPKKESSMI